ncbi:MAG TPA: hypothetical protein VIL33_01845, partial [Rhodothermia bacterium]
MPKAALSRILLLLLSLAIAPALGAQSAQSLVSVKTTNLPDLPSTVHEPLLGSVDGRPVVIGGWTGLVDSSAWSDEAWVLDPGASAWRKLTKIEGSFRPAAAMITVGNSLVVAGGRYGDAWSSSVSIVNRSADGITDRRLPDLPAPLTRPAGHATGQTVTVGGFVTGENGALTIQLYRLDVGSPNESWRVVPPIEAFGLGSLAMAFQNEGLFVASSRDDGDFRLLRYSSKEGWEERSKPEVAIEVVSAIALGQSHIAFLSPPPDELRESGKGGRMTIFSYSTITDTWADIGHWDESAENLTATSTGSSIVIARQDEGTETTRVARSEVVV